MRETCLIRNSKALEWGLNIRESYLFSWIYELPNWADKVIVGNDIYYFCSKTKIIEELPLLSDKVDTIYRHMKALDEKGIIVFKKIENRDYVMITKKGSKWNEFDLGKKSEHSDKNPSDLGKKSEKSSEKNPTDNYTIYDKYTIDNNSDFFDKKSMASKSGSDKGMYNFAKRFFEEFYKASFNQTYYWKPADSKNLYPLISGVYNKILEKNPTREQQITIGEICSGISYLIRIAHTFRTAYFLNDFSITSIYSKFNQIFIKIDEQRNGQTTIKQPGQRAGVTDFRFNVPDPRFSTADSDL